MADDVDMPGTNEVVDNTAATRFEIRQDGHIAVLVYELDGKRFRIIHTIVPEALGGHGLAGRLMQAAVARAQAEDLTVIPDCPYARSWLDKYPEVADTLTI